MRYTGSGTSVRSDDRDGDHPHDRLSAPGVTTAPTIRNPSAERLTPIRRDRLVHNLTGIPDDVPLVLLVAPPGYGKTIAVRQWAAEDARRFGWVHLDASDNDPIRLLRHIALAVHQIHPLDDAVWRGLDLPDASPLALVVPRMVASLSAHGDPWVLVLDDFQVLRGSLGLDVIIALSQELPSGCHLVVVSRHKPGLRLGRLRAQGRCVELGPAELGFTGEEVGEVLDAAGLAPSDELVRAVLRRTEGWPAGVFLATLSVRGRPDVRAAAEHIAGTDGFIDDYFREEVLAREPAETVQFLLRTAPLERISGPLCDAVLERTGSAVQLAELENRSLFVVPEDRDRRWYRYHRLFGEMLLAELRRREPGEEAAVHRRAAAWYGAHDEPERAITHALAGGDLALAVRLVTASARAFVNTGRLETVRSWLEALDDGALDRYPVLAANAGWIWALTGDGARAHQCLLAAENGSRHVRTPGELSPTSSIATLRIALAPLGVERMLADAQRTFALEPVGSTWHPIASMLLGVAHLVNSAPDAAAKALERAAHLGRKTHPAAASFALAQLSLLAVERGEWQTAEDYANESWAIIEAAQQPEYLSSIVAYAARARMALHQGDVPGAWRYVDGAQRLYTWPSPAAFPWLAAQAAMVLADILLDLGDRTAAGLKAADARRHLDRLLTEGALRDRYRQLMADLARYDNQPVVPGTSGLTAAEQRILQLLPTHLTLSEIADELYISRNTVKSQVASIYRKLRSSTRTEAVREGRQLGLIRY
jgi:LuxR family transcriptional regulator, maltose regulon positive regulatory protein